MLMVALIVGGTVYFVKPWRAPVVLAPNAPLTGSITSRGMALGDSLDSLRKRLGDLSVHSEEMNEGKYFVTMNLNGCPLVIFKKVDKENDDYTLYSIMCNDIEREGHPWLKVGMTREELFQALERPANEDGIVGYNIKGGRLQALMTMDKVKELHLIASDKNANMLTIGYFYNELPPASVPPARPPDPAVVEAVVNGKGYASSRAAQRAFRDESIYLLKKRRFAQLEKLFNAVRQRTDQDFGTPTDPLLTCFNGWGQNGWGQNN